MQFRRALWCCLIGWLAVIGHAFAVETITGTVQNQVTTAPIQGIDIDVFDAAGNVVPGVTDSTDAGGNYSLTLPGPGSYIVRADASLVDGVADEYYNNSFLKSGATPVTVNSNQTVNNINFTLSPGFTISGVTTSGATPLLDMDIDVFYSTGELLGSYNAKTVTGGAYTIGALPAGQYIVRADPDPALNQFYQRTYYNGTTDIATAQLITITSSNVSGININLAAGGTIAGTVVAGLTSAPLVGIDMDLYDLAGNRVDANAVTDVTGAYEIGPVAAGNYILRTDPTVAQGYVRKYYDGVLHFNDATPITVTAGARNSGKDFSLGLAGTISGTITVQGSGTPLVGIDLDVFDSLGRLTDYNASSGVGGVYQIGPVAPGQYFVRANPTVVQGYADEYYNDQKDLSTANPVTVTAAGNTTGVNFALVLAGVITGTVRDTFAQPLAGIDLDIFDSVSGLRLRRGATSDVNGVYQFDRLPPGTYVVRADPTVAQGYAMQYYNGKATYGVANVITVTSGNTQSTIDFALSIGGTISGNVSDTTFGAPAVGIDIDIYDANAFVKLSQSAITDLQGNYSLTNLPPGQYVLRINPGAGRPYFLEYYSNAATAGTATVVNVPAGGTVSNINFEADLDLANLSAADAWARAVALAAMVLAGVAILGRLRRARA